MFFFLCVFTFFFCTSCSWVRMTQPVLIFCVSCVLHWGHIYATTSHTLTRVVLTQCLQMTTQIWHTKSVIRWIVPMVLVLLSGVRCIGEEGARFCEWWCATRWHALHTVSWRICLCGAFFFSYQSSLQDVGRCAVRIGPALRMLGSSIRLGILLW